ncbi:MAG: VOC family protein [Solirubrobacteraceae bacterium]|nr:VOC family protein [Solirubrobacteraceae bacterium]
MKVMTQLAFAGQCREAFEHYARVLGGRITVMNTFGENEGKALPPGSSPAGGDKIRFAELRVGDFAILGNDLPADQVEAMRGFNVALHIEGTREARRIFDGLAEGGQVTTPLARVAWAALFGMVTDRYGVPWLVLALGE